ncbi:MBL fold metallo-hydrolase RNA specificity domain-containing protein [Halomonas sp. DQ26W]|uniref:MBL fold metallo-hydrolase RNA specificity domain-containing protein n=1 Tax=Halomonas sp. DQ26W TaxID=2282311 RepID=UPI001C6A71C6|nr:MBL fold metallo-hydrolase RNA specificity domain-containing protein [Halomonas sp. DQ26W]
MEHVQLLGPCQFSVDTIGVAADEEGGEFACWAGAFRNNPRFYLVHGESGTQEAFKSALAESGIEAKVPAYGDRIER